MNMSGKFGILNSKHLDELINLISNKRIPLEISSLIFAYHSHLDFITNFSIDGFGSDIKIKIHQNLIFVFNKFTCLNNMFFDIYEECNNTIKHKDRVHFEEYPIDIIVSKYRYYINLARSQFCSRIAIRNKNNLKQDEFKFDYPLCTSDSFIIRKKRIYISEWKKNQISIHTLNKKTKSVDLLYSIETSKSPYHSKFIDNKLYCIVDGLNFNLYREDPKLDRFVLESKTPKMIDYSFDFEYCNEKIYIHDCHHNYVKIFNRNLKEIQQIGLEESSEKYKLGSFGICQSKLFMYDRRGYIWVWELTDDLKSPKDDSKSITDNSDMQRDDYKSITDNSDMQRNLKYEFCDKLKCHGFGLLDIYGGEILASTKDRLYLYGGAYAGIIILKIT